MFDRASTFADPAIVAMLQRDFIPVAIDQAYQRRQQDGEGELYRHIASQGPRNDFANGTSQGFYVATDGGHLIFYNNNRNPERLRRLMREALDAFNNRGVVGPPNIDLDGLDDRAPDARYNPSPPEGGLVVRVRAKVTAGHTPSDDPTATLFQNAVSRDNLWVREDEHHDLVHGAFPDTLARRIARFHLVDNTRGEPALWHNTHIKTLDIHLDDDGTITGHIQLANDEGDRTYDTFLRGQITVKDHAVTGFTLAAEGTHHGVGRYTAIHAPEGDFTLAVTFALADPEDEDPADAIPPQGSRGWVDGYLRR